MADQMLKYRGRLYVGDMLTTFPLQVQPQISIPDYMTAVAAFARRDAGDMAYEPSVGLAYPREVLVPHNQKISAAVTIVDNNAHLLSSAPDFTWATFSVSGATSHIQMFRDRTGYGNQIIDVRCADIASAPDLTLNAATGTGRSDQGFRFQWNRGMFTWHSASLGSPPYLNLYFKVNTSTETEYSIQMSPGRPTRILRSVDGGSSYIPIHQTIENDSALAQVGGNNSRLRGAEFNTLKVRILGNKCVINMPGAEPITFTVTSPKADADSSDPEVASTHPVITQITLKAKGFTHLSFACHPVKFLQAATMRSNPLQLGFAPDVSTPPRYVIHTDSAAKSRNSGQTWTPGYPSGATVTVTTVSGTETLAAPSYDLDIDNGTTAGTYQGEDYVDKTLTISRVTMRVDGIVENNATTPVELPFEQGTPKAPVEVIEQWLFDPSKLRASHTLRVTFSNRQGWEYFRQITGIAGSGNFAVGLDLGYTHWPGDIARFTGFCHTIETSDAPNNERYVTLVCVDRLQQLDDAYTFAPPNYDGWNHYAAVAELMMIAGIALSDMAFLDMIPSDPFESTPSDTDPYYLPTPPGFRPWSPINRNLPVAEIIASIQKLTGFCIFVDNVGRLHYEPFVQDTLPAPKAIFKPVASSPGDIQEAMSARTRTSTMNVRNKVTLIGFDPFRPNESFIFRQKTDDDSISSVPPNQPFNFIGYPKRMLWMDARFANEDFATAAIDRLYKLVRQPEYTLDLESWMQPNIFPTDVVYWDDKGSTGSAEVPFYVFGITNILSTMNKKKVIMRSYLNGRYFDPSILQPSS